MATEDTTEQRSPGDADGAATGDAVGSDASDLSDGVDGGRSRSPISRTRKVAGRPVPSVAGIRSRPATSALQPADTEPGDNEVADPDPSDADPSDADLSDADLSDADLSDADLSDADLSDADLSDAEPSDSEPSGIEPEPVEPAGSAPATKAGRNLPAAIGVGLGLGGVIIASLLLYRPSFGVVVGLAVLYGCYELSKAMKTAGIRVSLLPLMVGSVAMLVAAWTRGPSGLVLAALLTVLGVLVWRIGDGAFGYARDVSASAFCVLYLPLLAGFAVLLTHPHDGAGRVIAFVATVVCSDTGGYATGVLFGRHPLAPIVSKAKTWEGFAGSVLACSGAGILFMTLTFHQAWWKGLLFGLALVVTATLGDLGESMIKRDLDIKDMGSLLPGHGGVMDRLDSLLPCAAVGYLLLSAFVPV